MKTPALTPALSPRKGRNARRVGCNRTGVALSSHVDQTPESIERGTGAPIFQSTSFALPLLGERAGVRAEHLSITSFHPRIATLLALCFVLGPWTLDLGTSVSAAPLTAAQTDFFETKVRPVLVENC